MLTKIMFGRSKINSDTRHHESEHTTTFRKTLNCMCLTYYVAVWTLSVHVHLKPPIMELRLLQDWEKLTAYLYLTRYTFVHAWICVLYVPLLEKIKLILGVQNWFWFWFCYTTHFYMNYPKLNHFKCNLLLVTINFTELFHSKTSFVTA